MRGSTHSRMPFGDHPPFISIDCVRAALEAMIHAALDASPLNPIHFLLVIEEQLINPDLPPSPYLRNFLVNQFLVKLITEEFEAHRKVFNLSTPPKNETRASAERMLQVDASKNSYELMGWSYVYYRYVRVDLGFTLDEISAASTVHERTLRRYHQRILERILEKIIEAEQESRSRQRKRRLLGALPQPMPARLVGRHEPLSRVRQILQENDSSHVYVTGSVGVGKTTLVQEIVRQQIGADQIDHLYWLRSPVSTQFVRQHIIQEQFPEGLKKISLREYLMMWRVAIVLDDADALLYDLAAVDEFLADVSPAFVYIISHRYQPLRSVAVHVPLQPLTRQQTDDLVRQLGVSDFDAFDEVWERTHGNPFAVRMLMRNPAYLEMNDDGVVQRLLMATYNHFMPDTKLHCLMLMLCPPENIEIAHLERVWNSSFNMEHIATLIQHQFVDMLTFDSVSLSTNVRTFLENYALYSVEEMALLQGVIEELEGAFEYYAAEALPIVEHILMSDMRILDDERREHWASLFANEGIQRQHWAIWRVILETLSSQNPMLQLYYGISLRRLAEWDMAEEAFTLAIAEAGDRGMFMEQARAMLELAVLLRYKGEYERAIREIERVERAALHYRDQRLLTMTRLEQAQIAIDAGNGAWAHQVLLSLPTTVRVLSLRSEAALLQNDLDKSLVYAKSAIPLAADDKWTVGRLYALLGRIYDAKGEFNSAKRYLSLAVTLLEQAQDVFALARAESNLAALLMRGKIWKAAEVLLLRSEKIQSLLGDRVALKTTQHNLQLVRLKLIEG
jgi:tetratricopeptide (TPR) repeat protein